MVTEAQYTAAVNGRREFREAYRRERGKCKSLTLLLSEAKDAIIDWETGANSDLLERIEAALKPVRSA